MTKIFVPQPIAEVAVERMKKLGEVTVFPHVDRQITKAELIEAVADKDILFAVGDIPYDADVIDAAKNLKMISAMHGAATFVDFDAASRKNVPVCGIPYRILLETTAEFTFALLIATAWRIPEADRMLRDGKWAQNQSMAIEGMRLHGSTLGIAGMGRIGQAVARRAKAFGLQIHYHNRHRVPEETEQELEATYWDSLDQMLARMDIISVNCPHTPATYHLLSARRLKLLKPTAYIVNTARGEVIDENALARMVEAGQIAGAGLDVFEHEPAVNPKLLQSERVVVLPHTASATLEGRVDMGEKVIINIKTFLDGHSPPDRVHQAML